jgi:SAM-dependent methyltransferase
MTPVFDAYSAYYDALYRDKDYAAEVAYVDGLVQAASPGARRLLDLGCGTGMHATGFASAGYEVLGIDASASMLERARERRESLPAAIAARMAFAAGDARCFSVPAPFDAVASLFHVASYQTGNDDITAMFAAVAAALAPGGVFVFDFWHGPAVVSQRPEARSRTLATDACAIRRDARPVWRPRDNVVEVHYDIEVRALADGAVQQFGEVHPMRYFFEPELRLMLAVAGFRIVDCRAWRSDAPPTPADWSAVVTAVRQA